MDEVIRRDEFVRELAHKNNVSVNDAMDAYNMVIQGIEDVVSEGKTLSLVRFGTFSVRTHKGHAVHLCPGVKFVSDYVVLKFAPAVSLTRRLRAKFDGGGSNG